MVEHEIIEGCIIITPKIIELAGADTFVFQQTAIAILKSHETSDVILDIESLDFVDSSFIGALYMIKKELAGTGKRLSLCNPSRNVRKIFKLAMLEELYPVHHTKEQAISAAVR